MYKYNYYITFLLYIYIYVSIIIIPITLIISEQINMYIRRDDYIILYSTIFIRNSRL